MQELTTFLESRLKNSWLQFPGIEIYIRRGIRRLPPGYFYTLDLANIKATPRGKGAWTRFITSLARYPELVERFSYVYVENVITDRFQGWFRARHWKERPDDISPSFYIETDGLGRAILPGGSDVGISLPGTSLS